MEPTKDNQTDIPDNTVKPVEEPSQAPSQVQSVPVMDVQPPIARTVSPGSDIQINTEDGTISQTSQAPSDPQVQVITPESPEPSNSENQVTTTDVAIEESANSPEGSTTSSVEAVEQAPSEASQSDNSEKASPNQQNPMAINNQPKKKSRLPKVVIFVAILVALSLCAAAIYAFVASKDEPKTETTSQNNSTSGQETKVQGDDIDKAITDLENDVNSTNDQEDIPSSESMNDATLGL